MCDSIYNIYEHVLIFSYLFIFFFPSKIISGYKYNANIITSLFKYTYYKNNSISHSRVSIFTLEYFNKFIAYK
jgi:hypothetical protein